MDNKDIFLTRDILDNLTVRVTNTLPYLKDMNPNTIWDTPAVYSQQIEKNVREVATVVLEAQKECGYYRNSTNNPLISHMILARVYILLYFRHKNEPLYGAVVFPELEKHMGVYGSAKLKEIQDGISKVLETERMIEQSIQEKMKSSKPKYGFVLLQKGEADKYYSEFNNELLFRQLCVRLEGLKRGRFFNFDIASIWMTAKDVVIKLWQEKVPENCIDRIYNRLSEEGYKEGAESIAAETVLLCIYAMVRSVNKSDHFHKTIKHIEGYMTKHMVVSINGVYEVEDSHDLLSKEILIIKEDLDKGRISFDNYDYTGTEKIEPQESFTKAEVEQMLFEQKTLIKQLKDENLKLKEKNESASNEIDGLYDKINEQNQIITDLNSSLELLKMPDTDLAAPQKVRMEIIRQLFEKSGLTENILNRHGNKAKAAGVMGTILDIPHKTCAQYLSDKKLSKDRHGVVMSELNTLFKELNLDVAL